MPLTAAERQRRYKEKNKKDPVKYEEHKQKKRANYHTTKKLVKDLTPKERYNARVVWKLRKQNLRQNIKKINRVLDITPPVSPSILESDEDLPPNALQNFPPNDEIIDMAGMETPENPVTHNDVIKKNNGRKKQRRDRSKLFRENLTLQEENEKLRKKLQKYKKRCQRSEHKKIYTKKTEEKDKYKKLSNAIRDRYQHTRKHKEKKILKDLFEDIDDPQRKEMIKKRFSGNYRASTNYNKSAAF